MRLLLSICVTSLGLAGIGHAQTPTRADCERACTAQDEQIGDFRIEGRTARCICECKPGWSRSQPNAACKLQTGSWSKGQWEEDFAVSTVLGTCMQTWKCTIPRGASIVRSPESRLVVTPKQSTPGICQNTNNPEECGRCAPHAYPAAACRYCVEPPECSNASLGWRSRQGLGCCS